MEKTTRMDRLIRYYSPQWIDRHANEEGLWYESAEEQVRTRIRFEERERRMAWVRAVMLMKLSPRERQVIEMHYLDSMTFREIAAVLGVYPSTAHRACQRGMAKLRDAAKKRSTKESMATKSTKSTEGQSN